MTTMKDRHGRTIRRVDKDDGTFRFLVEIPELADGREIPVVPGPLRISRLDFDPSQHRWYVYYQSPQIDSTERIQTQAYAELETQEWLRRSGYADDIVEQYWGRWYPYPGGRCRHYLTIIDAGPVTVER